MNSFWLPCDVILLVIVARTARSISVDEQIVRVLVDSQSYWHSEDDPTSPCIRSEVRYLIQSL